MTLSPFTRGMVSGSLSVENLLKLAKVGEKHPSEVLRMAGKGTLAGLIEELYGPASPLTALQREALAWLDQLSIENRGHFLSLLELAAQADARRGSTAEGARARPRARRATTRKALAVRTA